MASLAPPASSGLSARALPPPRPTWSPQTTCSAAHRRTPPTTPAKVTPREEHRGPKLALPKTQNPKNPPHNDDPRFENHPGADSFFNFLEKAGHKVPKSQPRQQREYVSGLVGQVQ